MTAPTPAGPGPNDRPNAGQPTPLSLLDGLRKHDAESWSRFHQIFGPLICWWCGRRQVPAQDIDDLRQQVYQTTFAKLPEFHRDQPGDTFCGWLCGITRRIIAEYYRKRKHFPHGEGGTDAQRRFHQLPVDLRSGGQKYLGKKSSPSTIGPWQPSMENFRRRTGKRSKCMAWTE